MSTLNKRRTLYELSTSSFDIMTQKRYDNHGHSYDVCEFLRTKRGNSAYKSSQG